MPPSIDVVECVEDECEGGEPFDVESGIFDVCVIGCEFDIWVELLRNILCNQGFRFLDVLLAKEELPVEVAQIDGVEIDDVNLAKAREYEVLEEFAANAAGANEE